MEANDRELDENELIKFSTMELVVEIERRKDKISVYDKETLDWWFKLVEILS